MARDFVIAAPGAFGERLAAWERAGMRPAPVKSAATVILLRDGDHAVEVFMQRRVATMAFAPSRAVFPGGSVDAGDLEGMPWSGPDPAVWGAALKLRPDDAAAVVTAAIRELFEEAGVLLAGPAHDILAADPGWMRRARARLLVREVTLAGLLGEAGLVARTDLLGYHAHWITPEIEPRRYDTHFFTALLPAGQQADAETTEAESAEWIVPARMLAESGAALMPPTIACLDDIAASRRAADLVRLRPDVPVIQPVPVRHGDGWAMHVEQL